MQCQHGKLFCRCVQIICQLVTRPVDILVDGDRESFLVRQHSGIGNPCFRRGEGSPCRSSRSSSSVVGNDFSMPSSRCASFSDSSVSCCAAQSWHSQPGLFFAAISCKCWAATRPQRSQGEARPSCHMLLCFKHACQPQPTGQLSLCPLPQQVILLACFSSSCLQQNLLCNTGE